MGRRLLLGIMILVALVAAAVFLDPSRTVLGWLNGEPFYQGRPASAWRKALLDDAPAARTNTTKTLADGKAKAVPVLILLLDPTKSKNSGEVRWTAADILGQIGPN